MAQQLGLSSTIYYYQEVTATDFFKHLEDGEITTIDDVSGWQVKVGYYGGKTEDPYWHCVGSRVVEKLLDLLYQTNLFGKKW